MTVARLVLLSAEPGSLDVVLAERLPDVRRIVAVSWDAPSDLVAEKLAGAAIVVVGADRPGVLERALRAAGGTRATELLRRTAPGRLLESFSPLHRSRLFAAHAARRPEWTPSASDLIVALDPSAAMLAWRAVRLTPGSRGVLGLAPALTSIHAAAGWRLRDVDKG